MTPRIQQVMALVVLSFACFGCTTIHYYHSLNETVDAEGGHLRIEVREAETEIWWAQQWLTNTDTSYDDFYFNMSEILEPYTKFTPDTSLSYIALQILYHVDLTQTEPNYYEDEIMLVPSDISVVLSQPYKTFSFTGFNYYRKHKNSTLYNQYIIIEPIGIPKSYKSDFTIMLNVDIVDILDSSLIKTERLILPIEYKKLRRMIGSWP